MSWTIEFSEIAIRQLKKLDKQTRLRIFDYLEKRICTKDDPRQQGKALIHNKAGLWRYRVGDFRLICQVHNKTITILVLAVGHRRDVCK